MADIYLYQIAYSQETLSQIEPGYRVLDNLDNLRPDWYEYWPIRNFLLNNKLDENAYYGFFSPKFRYKTNLNYSDVINILKNKSDDIVLFSPQFDMGAFFLNVIEQGEAFDTGFKNAFMKFIRDIDPNVIIDDIIMDSSNICFSNYFVAKHKFWMEWLKYTERLFKICEDKNHSSSPLFCHATTYPGEAQRKIFILERIVSFILSTQKNWMISTANPIQFGWSSLITSEYKKEALISDSLKIAYNKTKRSEYLFVFSEIRNSLFHNKER